MNVLFSIAFDNSFGIAILRMMDGLDVTDDLQNAGEFGFIQCLENSLMQF